MGFLDNLESNLKSLESRDEKDSQREQQRRDADARAVQASAPFADKLKNSAFTQGLMGHATRLGFAQRTKVHIVWLGTTLRLEAKDRKLELRPTPQGVIAAFIENGDETGTQAVDLDSDPEALARQWLAA
ncbi:MAG TPA: hypothetical protein VKU01_22960 [Bryobacteraceae bacterium]|nr:hypothetical protein [Bryobacteraceae bacterium]